MYTGVGSAADALPSQLQGVSASKVSVRTTRRPKLTRPEPSDGHPSCLCVRVCDIHASDVVDDGEGVTPGPSGYPLTHSAVLARRGGLVEEL